MTACMMRTQFSKSDAVSTKLACIGKNTGNLLFFNALEAILNLDLIDYYDEDSLDKYDSLITTELVWIRENAAAPEMLKRICSNNKHISIVPISVGLQASEFKADFRLDDTMEYVLKHISERAIVGVRGNYTAYILNKYGIKNVSIIGCPSVYQIPLFINSFSSLLTPSCAEKVVANYKTYFGTLSSVEEVFLTYVMEHCHAFVEQVFTSPLDLSYPSKEMEDWYATRSSMFFNVQDWCAYMSCFDFCLGARFHGNVAAILSGIPALFITCDSRTKEMVEFFKLPFVEEERFSDGVTPMQYAEQAAYGEFVRGWKEKNAQFLRFVAANSLPLNAEYVRKLEQFSI